MKTLFLSLLCTIVLFQSPAYGAVETKHSKSKITLGGEARIRGEGKNNTDHAKGLGDFRQFIASRFRANLDAKLPSNVGVFFQPQFTKTWGLQEINGSSTTTISGASVVTGASSGTSGALNDTALDVHQAFITYNHSEFLNFKVGRQELTYGDHLLVGNVGWSNVGRAFDAVKWTIEHSMGDSDLFWSKVTENNATAPALGDKDFAGFYNSLKPDFFDELDVYALLVADRALASRANTATFGGRIKSKFNSWDYRLEGAFQRDAGQSGNVAVAEVGFTLDSKNKTRIGAEYSRASKGFNQLFPTAHKWLGFADLYSRQNITDLHAMFSTKINDKLSAKVDWHMFFRTVKSEPARNFGGGSLGTVGDNKAISDEVDLTLKYKLTPELTLAGGGSYVFTKAYLRDNVGPDSAYFYYFQMNAVF